jgi:hypothetical protein
VLIRSLAPAQAMALLIIPALMCAGLAFLMRPQWRHGL